MKIIYNILLGLLLIGQQAISQDDKITIIVNTERSHQLRAIGFNENVGTFNEQDVRDAIRESKFNSLAFWGPSIFKNSQGDHMWVADRIDNVGSLTMISNMNNLANWCVEEGLDHIELLATYDTISIPQVCSIYTKLAQKLIDLGIPLTAISTGNKINTGHGFNDSGTQRRHPDSVALCAKLMRQKLDDAGLADIEVFGPSIVEWHPRLWDLSGDKYDFEDGDTALYLNALVNDPDALDALIAFDENSYGRSIGNYEYGLMNDHNKEFWISLHATDSYNNNWWTDLVAPVSAGNLLSNLNHGASLWNYWVLRDLLDTYRFAYLSNISQHFDRNGWIHRCKSTHNNLPTPWMNFNYNFKENGTVTDDQPDIIATAIENPDSSWSVGVVNLSGLKTQHKAVEYDAGLASTYEITIDIPSLKDVGNVKFALHESNSSKTIQSGDTVTMVEGKMKFTLEPKALNVLRLARIVPPDDTSNNTNISPVTQSKPILVYPVISSGKFNISYNDSQSGSVRFMIYSTTGRIIYDRQHNSTGKTVIDISQHPKGMYLLRSNIDNTVHKIIIR
ncbi:MAG: T9SS type A sorting domain-containing protein [Bacteroidetes bacterium]|jgi:hypothetical protein|nr:T9SS type A sorting domain-containing protein [Bacteroidota bacterium]